MLERTIHLWEGFEFSAMACAAEFSAMVKNIAIALSIKIRHSIEPCAKCIRKWTKTEYHIHKSRCDGNWGAGPKIQGNIWLSGFVGWDSKGQDSFARQRQHHGWLNIAGSTHHGLPSCLPKHWRPEGHPRHCFNFGDYTSSTSLDYTNFAYHPMLMNCAIKFFAHPKLPHLPVCTMGIHSNAQSTRKQQSG